VYLSVYVDGTDSVPKRRHIKFRRRGITQKKIYNKNLLYALQFIYNICTEIEECSRYFLTTYSSADFLPAIRGDLRFPTSSLNTESGGSSEALVTEIKHPTLRGDGPATTCASHFAALGIVQWDEILMSEGERDFQ